MLILPIKQCLSMITFARICAKSVRDFCRFRMETYDYALMLSNSARDAVQACLYEYIRTRVKRYTIHSFIHM